MPLRSIHSFSLCLILTMLATPAQGADRCGSTSTLSCPNSVAAALTSADCTTYDNTVYDVWQFSGLAGQTVSIAATSTAFDPLLILISPAGVPLAINDDASASTRDASLTFTLPSAGTWTVVVNNATGAASGDYVLSLNSSTCTPPGPRRRALKP